MQCIFEWFPGAKYLAEGVQMTLFKIIKHKFATSLKSCSLCFKRQHRKLGLISVMLLNCMTIDRLKCCSPFLHLECYLKINYTCIVSKELFVVLWPGVSHASHTINIWMVELIQFKKQKALILCLISSPAEMRSWQITMFSFIIGVCSCTRSGHKEPVLRPCSSSAWSCSWLYFTPTTWSTALPHSMSCMAVKSTYGR